MPGYVHVRYHARRNLQAQEPMHVHPKGGGARMAVTEHMVRTGGVELNVATAGHGAPVLLLHGFPDSWQVWRYQIGALAAAGYRVVAPDLRGYGRSSRPAGVEAYRVDRLLDDVVAVLADGGVASAAVVGHDWGAGLAWQLA